MARFRARASRLPVAALGAAALIAAVAAAPASATHEAPERYSTAADEGYYLYPSLFHIAWKPAGARGWVTLERGFRTELKRRKRYLRRYGFSFGRVEVRGRRGIMQCAHERRLQDAPKTETKLRYCDLRWREQGSTYSVLRYSRGISWKRLRRDVRRVARGLEMVSA